MPNALFFLSGANPTATYLRS